MKISDQITSPNHVGIWTIVALSNSGYICTCGKKKVTIPFDLAVEYNPNRVVYVERRFVLGDYVTASEKNATDEIWKILKYEENGKKVLLINREKWMTWIDEDKLTKYIFKTKKL